LLKSESEKRWDPLLVRIWIIIPMTIAFAGTAMRLVVI